MKVLIAAADKTAAKNGSFYLRVRYINDKKAELNAVMFEPIPEPEQIIGKVCDLTIKASSPADKIEGLVITTDSPDPYVKTTEEDVTTMIEYIRECTRGDGIAPELTQIVDEIFFIAPVIERMKIWPASKSVHHSFVGGLLEHTYSMMRIAEATLKHDPAAKGLDKGVVLCAIALHDIGKIGCYDFKPPAANTETPIEWLLGHICLADEMVVRACSKLNLQSRKNAKILNLRHCILAHHGKKEWGSPVAPCTREAVLIHGIDYMQSRSEIAKEGLEGFAVGEISDSKSRYSDGARLLRLE